MRKISIIGGIGYVVIFITGIFANFSVLESLRREDPISTLNNIQDSNELYLQGVFAFLIMVIADLLLTWVLYRIFKEYSPKRTAITVLFRLINVAFFGAALYFLFDVQSLIPSVALSEVELAKQVESSLKMFDKIWLIGLIFFGIHLVLLSNLLCKSKRVRKTISGLLLVAGIGYIIDSCLQLFYSGYESISAVSTFIVVLPGIIGELALTLWLLFKSGK